MRTGVSAGAELPVHKDCKKNCYACSERGGQGDKMEIRHRGGRALDMFSNHVQCSAFHFPFFS